MWLSQVSAHTYTKCINGHSYWKFSPKHLNWYVSCLINVIPGARVYVVIHVTTLNLLLSLQHQYTSLPTILQLLSHPKIPFRHSPVTAQETWLQTLPITTSRIITSKNGGRSFCIQNKITLYTECKHERLKVLAH
jgi:hypothetical protein